MKVSIVRAFGFAISVHDSHIELLIAFLLFELNV